MSRRRTPARPSAAIREINSGIYAFSLEGLFDAVRSIAAENAQGEYYLPDLVAIYRQRGLIVETVTVSNPDEIRGINSRTELAAVSRIVRDQKNAELMAAGVTIEDPATTYIDAGVTIGADTDHPSRASRSKARRRSAPAAKSTAARASSTRRIGDRVDDPQPLRHHESRGRRRRVRRPVRAPARRADVARRARKVGNFVELKKTVLGAGSKANAPGVSRRRDDRRRSVNIGAGTITCNYDGVNKNQTVIEDGAFIGSDSQLIAPVTIGKGAYVGSGTTIREDVPAGALAVSAGQAAEHRGLGRAEEAAQEQEGEGLKRGHYVRDHRIHRIEGSRAGSDRRAAAARVSRLRLGGRRGGARRRDRPAAQRRQAVEPRST